MEKASFLGPIAFTSSLMSFCLYSYYMKRAVSTLRFPTAKKFSKIKYFGKHPINDGQFRGENLMNPPKV